MIHKEQRKKLKEVLGYRYTENVLKILKEKKVTNNKGTLYGTSMIRNVFNGINENKRIENAILELYTRNLAKDEKRESLKNELLGLD
ncbi:hypothetical protein [Kordia sp.]|uniref:hypothetical protein n=1 Tax=Kordia sp. TaxID=1965332 RepID=UPI003D2E2265